MTSGWPMFAEMAARQAELRALPHYGGNKIPDSYLDKFNAETDAWLVRIGARKPAEHIDEDVPQAIADFARMV